MDIDAVLNGEEPYDINAAWASMKRSHAGEFQSFIVEHQKRALNPSSRVSQLQKSARLSRTFDHRANLMSNTSHRSKPSSKQKPIANSMPSWSSERRCQKLEVASAIQPTQDRRRTHC